ncbi:MAG TPA: molecular chaperone DnaJ [Alphaproteobacteria bacterium]|nr:molecular chaperone DnaJ [Paracoccaceae bacterium]HCY47042.1 molecular chaperone DnaJ [Alphaproteobacteria bacterium]|tara:strand:- start:732 stop:1304 length:573 start_codon:yes stop_codon:yes gene_type:complete
MDKKQQSSPDEWDISISRRRQAGERVCDWDGCLEEGEFPAPRSPRALRDYVYFCKIHVQEYNRGWNFFKDMSETECQDYRHNDATWHRPTWRMGEGPVRADRDDLGLDDIHEIFQARKKEAARVKAPPHLRDALETMGLAWPVTMSMVRDQRRKLVKKHHPDRHQGDLGHEEKLKNVLAAFDVLKKELDD